MSPPPPAAPSTRSTGFAQSRFDPQADERSRVLAITAASFDVCHPALALRALVQAVLAVLALATAESAAAWGTRQAALAFAGVAGSLVWLVGICAMKRPLMALPGLPRAVLVQAVLAVLALATAESAAAWGTRQAALAFAGVAGSLVWLVGICAMKRPLMALPGLPRAVLVLGLGAVAAGLAWWPLLWAGLGGEAHALRVAAVALGGVCFAALLWAWLDLRARIWHPADASARLAELQSRIRPHFLFNALNTALALVRVDPARAEAVLEDLSELFRAALAEVGATVTLEEEMALARHYLAIEQVRFGHRLDVQWEVDPRVHAARVPSLVLQPLVENAVRHGIEPAAGGGRVTVRAAVQRGQAVVTVINTLGPQPGLPGHGMALHNVRERLRLLHDVGAQCDVWREPAAAGSGQPDLFHARIVLPLP